MKRTHARMLIGGMAAVVATTTLGIGAASAAGTIPCAPRTLSKAFAQFGDMNDYFVVSDGTFENGAASWTSTGSTGSINLQAPWKVNGATHPESLGLMPNATAKTPPTCVTVGEDWTRFFYRPTTNTSAYGSLTITITAVSDQGTATQSVVLSGGRTTNWLVSPPIAIPNVRGERDEQWVTIAFTSTGGAGGWLIDDVMIDPFKVR